nr:GntR family transcriptional regulator [Novosphingobium sp. SG751A]
MAQVPAKADFTRSSVARYIQLATLFRRNMESGLWQVGRQIPTVDDLAEQYGVARATIRQAIGLLADEGLLSRHRAKGTFVNERPTSPIWCEVETDWNGLLSSRDEAEIEILADFEGVALPSLDQRYGTAAPRYRLLRRRHTQHGQRFLLAEVYIDQQLANKIPTESFTTMTALRLVASIPGIKIVEAHQRLTVGTADMETARLLDVPLNAPVCFVDRFAVDKRGQLVMVAKGIYRGDVIRLDMKLR